MKRSAAALLALASATSAFLLPFFNFESPMLARSCEGMDCYPELKSRLYQGDILLSEEDQRNGINVNAFLWPQGIVPFTLSQDFTEEERNMILYNMRALEDGTCIRFVMRTIQPTYISIGREKDKGCHAMVGFRPTRVGALPANLDSPWCMFNGTIQHELLHVLGLFHEQARYDRDDYVDILWENIDKVYHRDFDKADSKAISTYNIPYRYDSVMHYPRFAFSSNGKDTIVAKNDSSLLLGQRSGATNCDKAKIRRMYKCSKRQDEL